MARSENERGGTICQPISQIVPSPHDPMTETRIVKIVMEGSCSEQA
jgi:hypothetical protein